MVYYFSDSDILASAKTKKDQILTEFKRLCETDSAFLSSFEHTTKSIHNTFKRISTWGKVLSVILDIDIHVPEINADGDYAIKVLRNGQFKKT